MGSGRQGGVLNEPFRKILLYVFLQEMALLVGNTIEWAKGRGGIWF